MPFRYIIFPAGGAATHTTTGALTGPGAAIAGSATHKTLHTTTGALTGPGSTVAGVALHPHTTAGTLAGQGAVVAGAAAHHHATAGVLAGPGSIIAGSAAHTTTGTHATSGVLVGQGSAIAGTATHLTLHTTTGALSGSGSIIVGSALGPGGEGGWLFRQKKRKILVTVRGSRFLVPEDQIDQWIEEREEEIVAKEVAKPITAKPAQLIKIKPQKKEPEAIEPAVVAAVEQANARLLERIALERERLILDAEEDEVILWLM